MIGLESDGGLIEIFVYGSAKPIRTLRGPCHHSKSVEVESGGEVVARLCLLCDMQLPA